MNLKQFRDFFLLRFDDVEVDNCFDVASKCKIKMDSFSEICTGNS